jgi:hypothetical protein
VIDVINVMVVWCREVRIETGRCDVVPFIGRDGGRSSVEGGRAARCGKRSHDFAVRGLTAFVRWGDGHSGAVMTTRCDFQEKNRNEKDGCLL